MSGYLSIPVLALAVVVQSTLVPEARLGGAMPDLVFLLALSWSLMGGFERGVVWAIVGGVLEDLVSAAPVGTTALGLVLVCFLASLLLRRVSPRNMVYPALAAAAGTPVAHLVVLLVLILTGRPLPLLDLFFYVTLPSMIYNAVVMIPVYRVMGAFYLASRPRRLDGVSE